MNSCSRNNLVGSSDYSVLVNDYISNYRRYNQLVFKKIKSFNSIRDAVEYVSMAIDMNGKRFGHQQRFKKETLVNSKNMLLKNINKIRNANDFHELLEIVTKLNLPIRGVGDLYCYDTSLKLGSYLELYPKYIYLHSGTREGAKNLGLSYKKKYLSKGELPKELKKMTAYELEDFLCIYKEEFNSS